MTATATKMLSECWLRTGTIVTLTICLLSVGPVGSGARSQVRSDIVPTEIKVLRNLEYASFQFGGLSKKLLLDLYLPERSAQPAPLIIFLHGGGWFEGTKDTCPGDTFARRGYAMACVSYRLANHTAGCPKELSFPAQIHDVKAAVRWLRKHADKHGTNPNRFGALGASSGAHLAVLLGVSPGVAELEGTENLGVSDEVQAVADWFAPVDVMRGPAIVFKDDPCTMSINNLIANYGGEGTQYFYWTLAWATFLGGSLADPVVLKRAPRASPLTYIDRGEPPFLVIHGEADNMVPISQSEMLATALRNAGVSVTFIRLPGVGHGFAGPPGSGREVDPAFLEPTIKFFDARFRSDPGMTNPQLEKQSKIVTTDAEARIAPVAPGLENNTDRPGLDYKSFWLSGEPDECRKACAGDPDCKAFTYVRAGVQGQQARCYLKYGVPNPIPNKDCVSGIKQ